MSNKAMVAICDILGFSNLVNQKSLIEIRDYHLENFRIALESSIPQFNNPPVSPTSLEILKGGLVGFASFSDTVLIYSLMDNDDGYFNVIYAATRLIAIPLLRPELRFRVGISYGDFYHEPEKNIYVGKALVEAHRLETIQEWCGGALTKTAEEKIQSYYRAKHYLTEYDVPVKSTGTDKTEPLLAINWTLAKHTMIDKPSGWMERGYALPFTQEQVKIERKLKNTEQFHSDKCVLCRDSLRG